MLDYGQLFMQFLRFLKGCWKITKPFWLATGLIYPLAFSFFTFVASWEPSLIWWVIVWILMAYTLIQSLVRLFSKDKSIKLYKIVAGATQSRSERRYTNPRANTSIRLKEPSGVVFGRNKGDWICKPENKDGHILVVGGPGSGKSAAIAIPTLLSWKEAVFAIDIKGELSAKTKAQRGQYKVFGMESENYGYNPFYLISDKKSLVEQIKAIAVALLPIPAEEKNPFWKQNAQNYITGCFLWAYKRHIDFAEICEMIQAVPPEKMATAICEDEFKEPKLFMNTFVDMAHDTLSGIYSEVSNTIIPFATDDQLIAAISRPKEKSILPEDLDNGISIYIHLEEHRLEQLRNFLTLLVNQFLKHFEQRSEENSRPVLFLLDEFPRLGKIESIATSGLATLRSKKITICLIFQSLGQLEAIYGRDTRKAIFDNCSYWAILRVSDPESQRYFSDAIGTYDRIKKSYSDNKGDFKALGTKGISTTTEEKRIVKPEELNKLDNELIIISPYGFNRIEKAFYFKDKYFQKLLVE